MVGSLEPLEPDDLLVLVNRMPQLLGLPANVNNLDFLKLTTDYMAHLATYNLLQETETPTAVRPIIVQNTPQFAGCVFLQDPRDGRVYCAANPALGQMLESVYGCEPIVVTHIQNDQHIPMPPLPSRPPQRPLPLPPTHAATPAPMLPLPPPAPPLIGTAPLRSPLLVSGAAAIATPMTASVMHPAPVALDVGAALALTLQNLAVVPSSAPALPVDFPSLDRSIGVSVASQIVAIWESGDFPMRDWVYGSWNLPRHNGKKFISAQVTERAQQYYAVRVGLPSDVTPETCRLNATELKQLAARLKRDSPSGEKWSWFHKAQDLAFPPV